MTEIGVAGEARVLAAQHDCLLLDLDGTVFRGSEPTVGAVDALARLGARVFFITNNASRSATEVAAHLRELGFSADPGDIVTSAQTAARLLAAELPARAPVLVVGTDALAAEVAAVGLRPVRKWSDDPVAVVQGHSPATGWADLAEAALAIRGGARWLATNVDRTLPSERGLLPGNGAMVAALRTATEQEPAVAGKPQPALFADALGRGAFRSPLAVGDRLDTDIAGANAARLPSLLVLTGVSTARDAVYAERAERPTFIGHDLGALHRSPDELRIGPQRSWRAQMDGTRVTLARTGDDRGDDGLAVVRACADAVWRAGGREEGNPAPHPERRPITLAAGDDDARAELERWALLSHRSASVNPT